jgi:hypothetical protein
MAGLGPATHVFFGRIVLASRRGYPGQAAAKPGQGVGYRKIPLYLSQVV